jgi:group I intron endonuclease
MIVYLLFNNLNCKGYVGVTRQESCRWNKRLTNTTNPHLAHAIRKYGFKNFTRMTLAVCTRVRQANKLERHWIRILKTDRPEFGYNKQRGGLAWDAEHTEETRKQISERGRLRWEHMSVSARKRFSRTIRLVWHLRTEAEKKAIGRKIRKRRIGYTHSPFTKQKISKAMKKHWRNKRRST